MPHITPRVVCWVRLLVCLLIVGIGTHHAIADTEQDQFEDKTIARSVERAVRVLKSERIVWVKELQEVFADRVGNPLKEDEYLIWFRLLAG